MQVIPEDNRVATSAWDERTAPGDAPPGVRPVKWTRATPEPTTDDPPWYDSLTQEANNVIVQPTGEVRQYNAAVDTDRGQQLTTVELVKRGGKYYVVLDGQTHPVKNDSKLWLPRFREQQAGDGRRDAHAAADGHALRQQPAA